VTERKTEDLKYAKEETVEVTHGTLTALVILNGVIGRSVREVHA